MVPFCEQVRQLVGSGFSIFLRFQFERKICFLAQNFIKKISSKFIPIF